MVLMYYVIFISAGWYSTGGSTTCTKCPEGSYCSLSSVTACDVGYYSHAGSTSCLLCPAGHYCVNGSPPIQCNAGSYAVNGSDSCSECQPGFQCPTVQMESQIPCDQGWYSNGTGSQSCLECSAGYYCTPSVQTPCNDGYYSLSGSTSCTLCPGGYQCSDPSISPQPCLAGTFSFNGSLSCVDCDAGFYCPTNATQEQTQCPSGWYSSSGDTACTECTAGSYCTPTSQTSCASGYYSDAGQTSCDLCPGGYECSDASSPQICSEGTYARNGSVACTDCEEGKMCPGSGRVEPIECESGTYANETKSATCEACPAGHRCTDPSQTPEICIAGTYSPGSSTVCSSCVDGEYADTSGSSSCTACPAGYSCEDSSQSPQTCNAGTFSAGAAKYCSDCPYGWYADSSNSDSCTACPAGSACPDPSQSPSGCSDGYYSLENATVCIMCPAGHECPTKTDEPVACNSGEYAAAGETSCTPCPEGFYCPEPPTDSLIACPSGWYASSTGSTNCTECPTGHRCADATADPEACNAGYYADQTGSTECSACSPGYYTTSTGTVSCTQCPAGYKCPVKDQSPIECGVGAYSPAGSDTCYTCPAGQSCGDPTGAPTLCQVGEYSNGTACVLCPAGAKCPSPLFDPTQCPEGTYQTAEGQSTCHQCPAGHSCYDEAGSPVQCDAGYYSLAGQIGCTPCSEGEWSDAGAQTCQLCPAGQQCLNGTATVCDAGYYAPQGSGVCTPCPSGLYSESEAEYCSNCPAGSSCLDPSASPSSCNSGYYSLGGQVVSCTACPAGFHCSDPAQPPQPCAVGQYSSVGQDSCDDCPAGQSCINPGESPQNCDAGYYSELGDVQCRVCPAGKDCTYSNVSLSDCSAGQYSSLGQQGCADCPKGYMCPTTDQQPISCAPGQHTNGLTGQQTCTNCTAGQFCSDPANAPGSCSSGQYSLDMATACTNCPAGHECPTPSSAPSPCSAGFYATESSTSCTECTAGEACPSTKDPAAKYACLPGTYAEAGASFCTACKAGKYCPDTTSATIGTCGSGTYSYLAFSSCVNCPSGWKCPSTDGSGNAPCLLGTYSAGNATECTDCPAGFACPQTDTSDMVACQDGYYSVGSQTSCTKCPPGYECPDTDADTETECDDGYYSIGGQSSCTQCPAGSSCPSKSDSFMFTCWPGSYAEAGATECTLCPAGQACPATNSAPVDCDAGYYSLGSQTECTPCPAGFYCPQTDTEPLLCDIGFYSNKSSTACLECASGYACPEGSSSRTPTLGLCRQGYYCEDGLNELPCPAGTYGNRTGATSQDEGCGTCPQGYYCPDATVGLPGSEYICPRGHYCPDGTTVSTEYPCTAGLYNDQLGKVRVEDCVNCPAGKHCPTGSATGRACPKGHYCPEQTADPEDCPGGTFTEEEGATAQEQCKGCPSGYYCPAGEHTPLACLAGTFNNKVGQDDASDCQPCIAGWACTQPALTEPDYACDPGYYCAEGSSSPNDIAQGCPAGTFTNYHNLTAPYQCDTCPAGVACLLATGGQQRPPEPCAPGHYCPEGTQYPEQFPCPAGSYSNLTNLESFSDCYECTKGYFCLEGSTEPTDLCPTGHYCPPGTQWDTQYPCRAGTFSNREGNVRWEVCEPCTEGHYCPQGSSLPTPCPAGTFRDELEGETLEECHNCTAGYYCNGTGNGDPRPCSKGYYSDWGAEECTLCEPGFYCNSNATSKDDMIQDKWCPRGMWCKAGRSTAPDLDTDPCPTGHYCLRGDQDAYPRPCPNGTYTDQVGSEQMSDCIDCPAGKYCIPEGLSVPAGDCPAGHYCPIGTAEPDTYPCPVGFYLNGSAGESYQDCTECIAGYYCDEIGLPWPKECDRGYFCVSGSTYPSPCPTGTYGNSTGLRRSDDCTPCPGGYYCDGFGRTEPTDVCDAGFYCRYKAETSAPPDGLTGGLCPAGGYCPAGSAVPAPCALGTYSNSTGSKRLEDCIACDPGYYCAGDNNPEPTGPCEAGYYCVGGSGTPTQYETPAGHYTLDGAYKPEPCPRGTYQTATKSSYCSDCLQGYYCMTTGTVDQTICDRGHYCPPKSETPTPCPRGTYVYDLGRRELSECDPCPAGDYCGSVGLEATSGPCTEGYYCYEGSNTSTPMWESGMGDVCPEGHYCPAGTPAPYTYPCGNGTFNNVTGAKAESDCLDCPPGEVCEGMALVGPTGLCGAGYFCTGAAYTQYPTDDTTGNICPVGHYCPEGSPAAKRCEGGYYTNITGQAECFDCPAGYYCADGETLLACPRGHYCPKNTGGNEYIPCPRGYYNPDLGLAREDQCLPCAPGKYCTALGASDFTTLNASAGPCDAGYYCVLGNNVSNPTPETTAGIGGPCPAGFFCVQGTHTPQPCPNGTFSAVTHLEAIDECTPCDLGTYCGDANLTQPTGPCDPGFYCLRGASYPNPIGDDSSGGPCPIGHYCPLGTSVPFGCNAGTYNDLEQQAECFSCEAGYYCPANSTTYVPYKCPPGHYCPNGTEYATQYPCPRGYYRGNERGQSMDDCTPCDPGYYCGWEGNTTYTDQCDAGWFCIRAAWSPTPTDYDNYTSGDCLCPSTSTGGQCQPGSFCPKGSFEPTPCTEGNYCEDPGLADVSGPCDAGFYCNRSANRPDPTDGITGDICPVGRYCPSGTDANPPMCPIGTFSNSTGLKQESECYSCTPGHYCETPGLVEPTGPCDEGYYCPAGQSSPTPAEYNCTTGHRCPTGSPSPEPCPSGEYQDEEGQPSCKSCPPGYYCDAVEAAVFYGVSSHGVVIPTDCVAGYYCPQATEGKHQYPCLEGHFSNVTNLERHDQCQPCPGGTYCDSQGLTEYADLCDAGYVCVSGSNTSRPTDGATGYECLPGYYCPKGSDQGIKCPQGRFSNETGLENVTECRQCTPGFYCQTEGLTAPTGPCLPRYYCTLGAIDPNPTAESYGDICPAGRYCPEGTADPVECPIGTYLPDTGQDELSDCLDCTGGYYCDSQGQTNVTAQCAPGFYCISRANTSTPLDGVTGDKCPAGSYCVVGSSTPIPCADGYYMNHTTADACDICPSRYYCVNKDRADPCPKGRFCPQGTGFNWGSCPTGTYGPVEMLEDASECTQCDPGYYCSETGAVNTTGPCAEGYYCELGVDTPSPYNNNTGYGGPCTEGTYCPLGSAYPIGCPAGTYNDRIIQSECEDCPAGYYCLANFTTYLNTPCLRGFYCPQSTEYPTQYPCPAGTYNNRSLGNDAFDCLPCQFGKYCEGDGLDVPTGDCAPGWYCTRGAYTSKPHPFVNSSDSYTVSECPIYSMNETGGICYPGTYCPEGSGLPTPCPAGQYCELTGLDAPSGPCRAGYFCNGSSIVQDPVECSSGHYCPEGTDVEEPCPPGTFSGQRGNVNITDCERCTPGYYCEEYGLSAPNGPCEAGFFCPGGQDTSQPVDLGCSPGHFCFEGSWNQTGCPSGYYQPHWKRSNCDICPQGFFCTAFGDYEVLDAENMTLSGNFSGRYRSYRGVVVPTVCPPGSYCVEGTRHDREYLCPEGTFSNVTGLYSDSQCTPCEPGMYCQGEGNILPNGDCTAGYYCLRGANDSTPTDGSTGNICPAGKYCESGSVTGVGCPVGTFSNQPGLRNASECTDCTPGYHCSQIGLTKESGTCWAGHYCIIGSEEAAPVSEPYGDLCFPGHYCPNGTNYPIPCPSGTFLEIGGMGDVNDCTACSAGYYCESPGKTNVTGVCQEGFYCIRGANTSAPLDGITGDICWDGHYCPEGSPWPIQCGNGTFMNHTGAAECDICPEGYYCIQSDRADPCPQGYFCPEGTGYDYQPCPTGTYGANTGLIEESDCTPCTGGRYCDTPGSSTTDGPCAAGHYCEMGVDTSTPADSDGHKGEGGVCPPGTYCPGNTPTPIPCPAGTFSKIPQQNACSQCPAGYYCQGNTSDPYIYLCPVGHYCPPGTEYGEEHPCPEGTYNSLENQQNSTSCELCPPGEYCEGEGLEKPTGNCSEGWFCTGGSWSAKPLPLGNATDISMCTCPNIDYTGNRCPPGHYCPEASSHPVACTGGWYCDDYELSEPKGECSAGYYCSGGNSRPDPPTAECPVGHYCEVGTSVPAACPNGTFSNTTRNTELANCLSCTPGQYCEGEHLSEPTGPCDPGFYCPGGQNTNTPTEFTCPQGFHCPLGSSQPMLCPRGEYQPIAGQATCDPCPAGSYCDPHELGNVTGIIVPMDCIPGHYCPEGTEYAEQFKCDIGTFSNKTNLASKAECTNCTAGYYCDEEGMTAPKDQCHAGHYCTRRAETPTPTDGATGDICPIGHFCEVGSVAGVDCPTGRYGNTTGLAAETDCPLCDPGHYCPTTGLTEPFDECIGGHYCQLGAVTANPVNESYGYLCPVGHYCPAGTPTPVPCDRGYYQPLEQQNDVGDCIACDGGYYCLLPGQANVTAQCDAGFYCSEGAYEATPTDGVTGDVCPIGHYCPTGTEIPVRCANGTYMNTTNAVECLECPAGYYCINGDYPIPCEAGYYCPSGTAYELQPCPEGTYGPSEGLASASECTECSGGSFCDQAGLDAVSGDCDEGYYCVHGVNVSAPQNDDFTGEGGLCPVGHECPQGSTHPRACQPGSYAPLDGMASCKICPSGKYCENATVTPSDCPVGHYCPAGTEYADQYPCPEGTYNNATGQHNDTNCQYCPPGMYCEHSGLEYPSGLCDEGFYCSGGSDMQRPFDVGITVPLPTPLSYVYPNDTCHPMYDCVCPDFTLSVGGLCPPGHYCPVGSDAPESCIPGMYCATPGLAYPTGYCYAGYYCNHTSSTPDQYICPAGHYCNEGTDMPVACPPGTYSGSEGNRNVTDCITCQAGKYCEGFANTAPDDDCQAGYYCPGGQTSKTPVATLCPAGFYCPTGSWEPLQCPNGTFQPHSGQSECGTCPAGFFCDPLNGTAAVPCPAGYYCPPSTSIGEAKPCPAGTFSADNYLWHVDNCTACTAGYYCETPALTAPTGECFAGYYCTGGASSPTPVDDSVDPGNNSSFTGNDICPRGYYCVNGTVYPEPCPIGTFSVNTKVTGPDGCEDCRPGRYCNIQGFVKVDDAPLCDPGYVCTGGSTTPTPTDPSMGYVCPAGLLLSSWRTLPSWLPCWYIQPK
ncbi:uncharacterized protein [Ptychodera flava]|uniref:uncharacterized protein isoform X4 n=1 Tax=Ptychodera flava TaxID=63121 RepID=UPI00396A028C